MYQQSPVRLFSLFLMLAGIALFGSACVSKSKYDELQTENARLKETNQVIATRYIEAEQEIVYLIDEIQMQDDAIAILQAEQAELETTLQQQIVDGAVGIELMKSGLNVVLDNNVLFPSGSATLSDAGKKTINDLAGELTDVPYQILVIGNTDNVPVGPKLAEKYPDNWALAAARATAVVSELAADGIPAEQLVAISLGDSRPVASNDTAEGRADNRRIEVRLRPVVADSGADSDGQ